MLVAFLSDAIALEPPKESFRPRNKKEWTEFWYHCKKHSYCVAWGKAYKFDHRRQKNRRVRRDSLNTNLPLRSVKMKMATQIDPLSTMATTDDANTSSNSDFSAVPARKPIKPEVRVVSATSLYKRVPTHPDIVSNSDTNSKLVIGSLKKSGKAYPRGTKLEILGKTVNSDGEPIFKVREQGSNEPAGYVSADPRYSLPEGEAPTLRSNSKTVASGPDVDRGSSANSIGNTQSGFGTGKVVDGGRKEPKNTGGGQQKSDEEGKQLPKEAKKKKSKERANTQRRFMTITAKALNQRSSPSVANKDNILKGKHLSRGDEVEVLEYVKRDTKQPDGSIKKERYFKVRKKGTDDPPTYISAKRRYSQPSDKYVKGSGNGERGAVDRRKKSIGEFASPICEQIKAKAKAGKLRKEKVTRRCTVVRGKRFCGDMSQYFTANFTGKDLNKKHHVPFRVIKKRGKVVKKIYKTYYYWGNNVEGSFLHGGKLHNYGKTPISRNRTSCKFGFGNGRLKGAGDCLDPCHNVAADQSIYPAGTVLYFKGLDGKICPQTGKPVDGCVTVKDVGSAIKQQGRFDIYTGECIKFAGGDCKGDKFMTGFKAARHSEFYVVPRNNSLAQRYNHERQNIIRSNWQSGPTKSRNLASHNKTQNSQ